MRRILKTINTVDEFDKELYEKVNIGVEIQDFTEPNLSNNEIEKIVREYEKKFKNFKAIKALHGPFLDLKPASPDLKIRQVSYNRYLDSLNIASRLDMDYIIFHSQINPYLNEPFLRNLNNSQAREIWKRLLAETDYKSTILIENIFEEEPSMLKEYMDNLAIDNIKLNLDIGHARLGKVSLEDWIRELKDHIAYMHLHSNNGSYDQHRAMEEDEIESLYELLDKYKINPVLSLEYKVKELEEEISKYR